MTRCELRPGLHGSLTGVFLMKTKSSSILQIVKETVDESP